MEQMGKPRRLLQGIRTQEGAKNENNRHSQPESSHGKVYERANTKMPRGGEKPWIMKKACLCSPQNLET